MNFKKKFWKIIPLNFQIFRILKNYFFFSFKLFKFLFSTMLSPKLPPKSLSIISVLLECPAWLVVWCPCGAFHVSVGRHASSSKCSVVGWVRGSRPQTVTFFPSQNWSSSSSSDGAAHGGRGFVCHESKSSSSSSLMTSSSSIGTPRNGSFPKLVLQ